MITLAAGALASAAPTPASASFASASFASTSFASASSDDPGDCPQGAVCLYENPNYTGAVTVLQLDRMPSQCATLPHAVRSGINNSPYFMSLYDAPECSRSTQVALLPAHSMKPAFPVPMRANL